MSDQKKEGTGMRPAILVPIILSVVIILVAGIFLLTHFTRDNSSDIRGDRESSSEHLADSEDSENSGESVTVEQPQTGEISPDISIESLTRTSFLDSEAQLNYNPDLVPCIPEYHVEPDLSNVIDADRFYFSEEALALLTENGFYVTPSDYGYNEFFQVYEDNRYFQKANFVTVDSLMHTYHIYFSYLLKKTEQEYLADSLAELSKLMLEQSLSQYEALKGTEWEDATLRNVAFFAVGACLQDDSTQIPESVNDTVNAELALILAADGISPSPLMGADEDYSQYKPRGYYDGNEQLENYFRTMMWYGRISFLQEEETTDRSALLMTLALNSSAFQNWKSIYSVTSFFAGASDDPGFYEYMPLICEAYGDSVTIDSLAGNEEAWQKFHELTGQLTPPAISSIPIMDGEDNVIRSFRFMGQRFSVDAAIMQKLIYSNVGANPDGDLRMLPDVLDVPAALGSDAALSVLEAQGDTAYEGYEENMNTLRAQYENAQPALWTASLYAYWLNTLRPLLGEKGEGYPFFMQTPAWSLKTLETFAGSYTELKHDTVLYSKQVMAEMGGGDINYDDRGYVQPEPLVYARFEQLALQTAEGLSGFGMLEDADYENLRLLAELAAQLVTISEKELVNETLTDDEYELIRCYGGNLEHFWLDAMREQAGSEYIAAAEYPCPLVVDIATDPNGSVLEAANGNASTIYVAVLIDGKIQICSGSVYSFYQFEWPLNDRLTDTQWRLMMGWSLNENNEYERTADITPPDWTQGYRAGY